LICPTCGKRNPPGAAACSRCGRWLATNRMQGVTYHRADLRRGSGPGAVAIGAALIAGLLFVGGAIYVSLLGGLQGNGPGTSPIGAIDTPISSLPIFVQPTPTPTPTPSPTPTLPWYLTPSPSFDFGSPSPSVSPSTSATPGVTAPVANFRGTIQGDGLTVVWTDKSTGDITSWSWDFGDGYGSDRQAPSHTYAALGDYNVMLTVTGPGGSSTKTKVLHLKPLPTPTPIPVPVAKFTCSVDSPGSKKINCDASGSTNADTYSWDFNNDGQPDATEVQASWTFDNYSSGDGYPVTLTVTGPGGTRSKTKNISVPAPTPSPSPPSTSTQPSLTALSALPAAWEQPAPSPSNGVAAWLLLLALVSGASIAILR
jgi:PKD repeat protein